MEEFTKGKYTVRWYPEDRIAIVFGDLTIYIPDDEYLDLVDVVMRARIAQENHAQGQANAIVEFLQQRGEPDATGTYRFGLSDVPALGPGEPLTVEWRLKPDGWIEAFTKWAPPSNSSAVGPADNSGEDE